MQLKQWLKTNGVTQREFSRLIKITEAKMSHLCSGHTACKPEIIDRINKATKGQVCACDIHRHYLETKHPNRMIETVHISDMQAEAPTSPPSPAI